MNEYVEHDLSPEELTWLVEHCPDGESRWTWVTTEAGRMEGPLVRVERGQITEASAQDATWTQRQIVRAVYDAMQRKASRRSASAKKAAATRKARQDTRVHDLARYWLKADKLPPSRRCHLCGKEMEDSQSIQRGIGPDCWQHVLHAAEQIQANVSAVTAIR